MTPSLALRAGIVSLAIFLAFARQRGLWLVADEVYSRIVYGNRAAPSFLDQADPEDRVIVVNSFSKNWR